MFEAPIFTSEAFFPVVGTLGAAGIVYSAVRGSWFLPTWFVVVVLLGMRGMFTYAMVPMALLAGVAVEGVLLPGLRAAAANRGATARRVAPWAALAVIAGYACLAAVSHHRGELTDLRTLPADDRQAMAWMSHNAPGDARVLVVPVHHWFVDQPGEWFPALAQRENVLTPQGYEWVRNGEFVTKRKMHDRVTACAEDADAACIEWATWTERASYIFVPADADEALRQALLASPGLELLYNDGAIIFRPR